MGIVSVALKGLKYLRAVPRYAFGEGYGVISSARKAAGKAAGKGTTIFSGAGTKTKAGLSALKRDLVTTANRPSRIANAWKSGVLSHAKDVLRNGGKVNTRTKLLGGLKGLANGFTNTVKGAWKGGVLSQAKKVLKNGGKVTNGTKLWGGLKGIAKPLCKMPVLASLITLGYETYENIYPAFKNEGFLAGMKEIGKSSIKVAVGAAAGALGTVVAGPIGGIIGYAAGEMLTSAVMGGSYSENHPAEVKDDETAQAQANGVMPETDTQAARDQLRAENEAADAAAQDSSDSSDKTNTDETQQTTATQTQEQTSNLPERLEASDTTPIMQQPSTTNPYLMNNDTYYSQYTNPFGFDAGSNIFQRFPMGYKFQYQGNGMGMMM